MEKAETFKCFLFQMLLTMKSFIVLLYELEEEINTSPTFSDYYNLLKIIFIQQKNLSKILNIIHHIEQCQENIHSVLKAN